MHKLLITGGKGDIAKAIIAQLTEIGGYEIKAPGRDVMDVTDPISVTNYVDTFVPDILINNAGYVVPMSIGSCDIYSEKKAIDINLFGTFNCTAAVLRKNPEAKIINIGSSAATKVHGTWSSYCAAKAAVVMATQCWAEDGIDAVCISPARTATKMRKELFPDEDQNTLLSSEDFAKVVIKAINSFYKNGAHINVTKQNVQDLINN